ncbi:hypothetical protein cypCar_00035382 [Cyprinus carpio]|nr:hypothetical protein cypCar_00035382 [Cyprinus carpio]
MFFYMKVLSTLLCILLLHQNASESCPAGHRQNYITKKCELCPQNQYRSTSGTYLHCENCSKCKTGSIELNSCTFTSDTKCKCKIGFTPIDREKEEICSCEKGSGIDETGICKKCEDGFFTDKENSICQKWREFHAYFILGLVILCAGILLLAGVLYHKCTVAHCIHNHKKVDFRKESVCRKPVEESGDKCQSLLV